MRENMKLADMLDLAFTLIFLKKLFFFLAETQIISHKNPDLWLLLEKSEKLSNTGFTFPQGNY